MDERYFFIQKLRFFLEWCSITCFLNLRAYEGGIVFRETSIKNHLIGSDLDLGNVLPEHDFLFQRFDWKTAVLYNALLLPFETVKGVMTRKYSNTEYLNNTDLVVPISSQLSSRVNNAVNIENNPVGISNSSICYGLDKVHQKIQNSILIGNRVMRLLNAEINSGFFANSIDANSNSNGTLYRSANSLEDSVYSYYDTSYIRIISPVINDTLFVDSIHNVQIHLKNNSGLQEVKVAFQGNILSSTSTTNYQSFNLEVKPDAIGNNILLAQATYDSLGFTINHVDTITVYVKSLASLNGFYVSPKSQILNPKQIFQPELNAIYSNYVGILNNDIDFLNFTIADTNVVRYDSVKFQFIAKDTGTTHILFNYRGFNDTAFVYLSYTEENANVTNLCPQGNTSFSAGINDPTKTYQWQVDAGSGYSNVVDNSIYSGAQTSTLNLFASPTSLYGYSYRCIISDNVGTNITTPQTLKFIITWTGASNTAWENSANWNCGILPDENTDVVINSGIQLYPILNSNVSIRSLMIKSAATINISNGFKLNLTGKSQ